MSRLGKLPIKLPAGTQAALESNFILVKGPKGELREKLPESVKVDIAESEIRVTVANKEIKKEKALWGLFRSLINNMVIGVNDGFEKKLEINGVGYRANVTGKNLILNVGYSHPVESGLVRALRPPSPPFLKCCPRRP